MSEKIEIAATKSEFQYRLAKPVVITHDLQMRINYCIENTRVLYSVGMIEAAEQEYNRMRTAVKVFDPMIVFPAFPSDVEVDWRGIKQP